MGKTKTLKKQKNSSNKEPQLFVKLKDDVVASKWEPGKELLNETKIAKALFQCLKTGDTEEFKEILSAYLEATQKYKKAKKKKLSPRTMYNALSEKGNPNLETISKLVQLAFT